MNEAVKGEARDGAGGTGAPVSFQSAFDAVRHETGVVIPAFIPECIDLRLAEALIEDTVAGYCRQVADPAAICLSVDGPGAGVAIAERLGLSFGVSVLMGSANRGKLAAVRAGAGRILDRPSVRYLAVVDQDGDHFPNELPGFVRAAEHIRRLSNTECVLVLGRRSSRHRPLGFLRGEHEELADRILLNALRYHAVTVGRPLRLEYAAILDDVPDFHSGYKLFTREAAVGALLTAPELAGVSDDCYFRHAVEAVMVVEALVRGAELGVVNRSTFNVQPMTTFGQYERCRLVADMIVWPCKRLGVPERFARQWLANSVPLLLLSTLAPGGKAELDRIVELVLEDLGSADSSAGSLARGPMYV